MTWQDYEADLDRRIEDLSDPPSGSVSGAALAASVYSEARWAARPLAVAALEDKVVQRATTALLNAIYDAEFLGFSYGFRRAAATTMRWARSTSGSTAER